MEPERLGHGDALGGPARLLASTVRSRVRSWSTEGGHGQAPQGSRVACPGSTDMPGTRQQERGRPRLLLRLPREAGMIPSGNGARRGAQDRLAVPSDAGAGDPGPSIAPCPADLPLARAARASGGGRTPSDAVLLCQGASAPLCLPPPPPAGFSRVARTAWSLELPVLARKLETCLVRGRSWAEAPRGETGSEWHRELVEDKPNRGRGRRCQAFLLEERLMRGLRK